MESRKGEHILEFDEVKHRYKLDGSPVPGTTTFAKGGYPTSEMLVSWMVGQGATYAIKQVRETFPNVDEKAIVKASKTAYRVEAEKAAGIGTTVHDYAYLVESGRVREAVQLLSEHENSPHWEQINNGAKKFDEWKAQNKGETVLLEAIVASVVHQYGGKFDHLSLRDGRLVLSDYKTSNGIYVDQYIQLAAYAIAIEEWLDEWLKQYGLPLEVGGLEILRFGKDSGDYQALLIDNKIEIRALKEQAIRCRQTYKFRSAWESDKRFKFNGGANGNGGNPKAA